MRPLVFLLLAASPLFAAGVEKGSFAFKALDDQKDTPERFRLSPREGHMSFDTQLAAHISRREAHRAPGALA